MVVIVSVWKSNGTGMGVVWVGCADETLSHCCHAGIVHSQSDEIERRVARLLHNAMASHPLMKDERL